MGEDCSVQNLPTVFVKRIPMYLSLLYMCIFIYTCMYACDWNPFFKSDSKLKGDLCFQNGANGLTSSIQLFLCSWNKVLPLFPQEHFLALELRSLWGKLPVTEDKK